MKFGISTNIKYEEQLEAEAAERQTVRDDQKSMDNFSASDSPYVAIWSW